MLSLGVNRLRLLILDGVAKLPASNMTRASRKALRSHGIKSTCSINKGVCNDQEIEYPHRLTIFGCDSNSVGILSVQEAAKRKLHSGPGASAGTKFS